MADSSMRLSDLCDCVGVQVDPAIYGDATYVGLEHVASGRFVQIGAGKASDVLSGKFLFRPGDVLYGKLRPYLDKAILASAPGICTTELLVLRPKEGVDPRFLVALVHAPDFVNHAIAGTTGVQHPRTSWRHIADFELPAFDPAQRTKIADLLWKVHNALTANEAAVEAGLDLKRAAMQALFAKGVRGEAQVETEIGPVPENWTVGPIGQFAQFQRGFDITKSRQKHGTVPVVSSGGIRSYHHQAAASGPGVIIGRKGSIGSLHYVEGDYWPHDTTLWCKDFLGNLPKFVFYRLSLVDMKRLDSGATNPALNRNFLHAELTSWPAPPEQQKIVTILDAIDRKIERHRQKGAVLDELFKALLHKLMSGEIQIADLDLPPTRPLELAEVAA